MLQRAIIDSFPKDGFMLETNKWDFLPIDDLVLTQEMSTHALEQLENAGYLGSVYPPHSIYSHSLLPNLTPPKLGTIP